MIRVRQIFFVLTLCTAAAGAPAFAEYPVAPDVVVFCEPTLRPVVDALGAEWRKETGIPVRVFAATTTLNLAMLAHHTRDDVLIGEGDAAASAATAQNLIKSETIVKLWGNHLVAAALAAEFRKASLASPPARFDLASVAGKAEIAIVDPPVAAVGGETEQALQKFGLWEVVRSKSIGVVDTEDAAFLLSEGDVKLAVLYATDVAVQPNFAVTDTLPEGGQPIIYWAAQTQRALSPNTAKFLDFLRRADSRARGRDVGLEVLP
jgi:ABC-type molybdate transport system substrate-binding protein